jgi:hypothetical protein
MINQKELERYFDFLADALDGGAVFTNGEEKISNISKKMFKNAQAVVKKMQELLLLMQEDKRFSDSHLWYKKSEKICQFLSDFSSLPEEALLHIMRELTVTDTLNKSALPSKTKPESLRLGDEIFALMSDSEELSMFADWGQQTRQEIQNMPKGLLGKKSKKIIDHVRVTLELLGEHEENLQEIQQAVVARDMRMIETLRALKMAVKEQMASMAAEQTMASGQGKLEVVLEQTRKRMRSKKMKEEEEQQHQALIYNQQQQQEQIKQR